MHLNSFGSLQHAPVLYALTLEAPKDVMLSHNPIREQGESVFLHINIHRIYPTLSYIYIKLWE